MTSDEFAAHIDAIIVGGRAKGLSDHAMLAVLDQIAVGLSGEFANQRGRVAVTTAFKKDLEPDAHLNCSAVTAPPPELSRFRDPIYRVLPPNTAGSKTKPSGDHDTIS